jgi:dienelactone hydrolase
VRFYRRRSFWLAAVTVAVVAFGAMTAISYFAAQALTHHRSARPAVTPADSGLIYQTVPLMARDGTKLEGWWIIPRDGVRRRDLATVVLAHAADGEKPGAPTGKAGMLWQAAWLSRAGYIVLSFDFRSYGGSEGRESTGGEKEQQDIEAALRLVHERALGAPVAILGEGLGARVGLRAQAQAPGTIALVADSPRRDRISALKAGAQSWTSVGVFAQDLMPPEREPVSFETLLELAGAHPLMLILGTKDHAWSPEDRAMATQRIGRANATWVWQPPAAGLRASALEPREYERHVIEFLDGAFAADRDSTNLKS